MNQVLEVPIVREVTHSVVADQPCAAIRKAQGHGVETLLFDEGSNTRFCARLANYLSEHEIDYVLSFYTPFYTRALREEFSDRIINFHPSLLPAFKGMDGFGDSVAYHTKIIGTTVELIKDVMDEGKIIMQTACAVDPGLHHDALRHRIFVQQCKTLVQTVWWIRENRLSVEGDHVTIANASYDDCEFVPSLDARDAVELQVPFKETGRP